MGYRCFFNVFLICNIFISKFANYFLYKMYIKRQKFKDKDTLLEYLFDFEIGEPSAYIKELKDNIEKAINEDIEIKQHISTMESEDALEYIDELIRDVTADRLLSAFEQFEVKDSALYAISKGSYLKLYEIDLI